MNRFARPLLWLATIGLVIPQVGTVSAAGPHPSPPGQTANELIIADVALTSDGLLRGQVVDRTGTPKAHKAVTLSTKDQVVGQATTDKEGVFAIPVAKGGVYALTDRETTVVIRVWTHQTAPPAAKQGLLVISDQQLVRGALGEGALFPWVIVGAIGVAIGAAAIAENDAS
jgi:hypothetical protein